MSRQAQQREGEAFVVEDATVVLTDGATSVVRTRLGDLRARRAASCLVDPMPKDRVLVALSGDEVFILAVLVRAGEAPVRLSSDESVEIVSRKGTVSILAQEGVTVASAKAVEISGAELGVHAERARVALAELGFVGKLVDVSATALRVAAERVERTAGRLVERLGRSYRFVEETEQLRAKEIDLRAEGNLAMRADHTVVLARKIVKFDGSQVHIG